MAAAVEMHEVLRNIFSDPRCKGRIAIPASERAKLSEFCGSRIVVTADLEDRLLVYPEPFFDELVDRLNQLPGLKPTTEALQRTLLGYASHSKLDAQGRVLLTPAQRTRARLEKEAVLIGIGNRYQLWRKDAWQEQAVVDQTGHEGRALLGAGARRFPVLRSRETNTHAWNRGNTIRSCWGKACRPWGY
jgi:MraZ protein